MPQLVPFFFINQVTVAFAVILLMVYVFSKYILPKTFGIFITRISILNLLSRTK